jgi:hypothetical protein
LSWSREIGTPGNATVVRIRTIVGVLAEMQGTIVFEVSIGFTIFASVDNGTKVGGCDDIDFESEALEGDLKDTVNACEGEVEEGVAGRGDARAEEFEGSQGVETLEVDRHGKRKSKMPLGQVQKEEHRVK